MESETEYKTYYTRWTFLASFTFSAIVSGSANGFFAPIAYEAKDYYGVNLDMITLFA